MSKTPGLSVKDVAPRLGIDEEVLYRLCRQRRFPHMKYGRAIRFTEDHVREGIELFTVPVKPREQLKNPEYQPVEPGVVVEMPVRRRPRGAS